MSNGRFPWRDVLGLGLGRLRIAPRDFWEMTPRELNAAAEGAFGRLSRPLERETMETLMARYPDEAR